MGGRQFYTLLTSALDGGEWPASSPNYFSPGEGAHPSYQLNRRLSGPQSRSGCGGEDKTNSSKYGKVQIFWNDQQTEITAMMKFRAD
jgi:hypothetical protein